MISALDLLRGKRIKDWTMAAVAGEEEFLRSEAVDFLLSGLPKGFETRRFEWTEKGAGPSLAEVLDELRSRDLFGGTILVHLSSADAFLKQHGERLARFLQAGEAVQPLLVEGERILGRGKKATPTGVLAEIAKASGTIVQCDTLYESTFGARGPTVDSPLSQWVVQRAKSPHGKSIEIKTAFLLHRLIGNHLRELDAELEKLALAIGERDEIKAEDIRQSISAQRLIPIFDLVAAVFGGRLDVALDLAQALFERGLADAQGKVSRDPTGIAMAFLGAFSMRLRAVGRAHEMMQAGADFEDAARAVGQFGPFAASFRSEVDGVSQKGVLPALARAARELERSIKRGVDAKVAFDLFLIEGRGRSTRRRAM